VSFLILIVGLSVYNFLSYAENTIDNTIRNKNTINRLKSILLIFIICNALFLGN